MVSLPPFCSVGSPQAAPRDEQGLQYGYIHRHLLPLGASRGARVVAVGIHCRAWRLPLQARAPIVACRWFGTQVECDLCGNPRH